MTIEALIFDCDGTLTDSMPVHYESWKAVLDRHGLHFERERFYRLGGTPGFKIIPMLADEQNKQADVAAILQEKEEEFLRLAHLVTPIEPIVEVARSGRGQLRMAVASGGLRHIIDLQLTQIGIVDWFDVIVTAEDTERHKPEPDVFLEAARRLDVEPAKCRVYEDSDVGIEAAQRAGMQCVDVRSLHTPDPIN